MSNKITSAILIAISVSMIVCMYLLYEKLQEHDQKIAQIEDTLSWTINVSFIPE